MESSGAEETKEEVELKPWEQHSAVISLPRFDYNAPAAILSHSHSGFLITCPIKREKSATKEAMSIFQKYFSLNDEVSERMDTKRRKLCKPDNDTEAKQPDSCTKRKESGNELNSTLSLVKLTRSGMLLFIFPKDEGPAAVDIVTKIIQSRESGSLKSLQWCNRIFPIQATCGLDEKELHNVVFKLVQQFQKNERSNVAGPVKFAVGYNRRGIEENEMKHVPKSNPSHECALIDRAKCFSVVAAAVKDVFPDSVVNLKCPELAVLVEILPLSGISNERIVVGVSVLSQMLVSLKPRLSIKALVYDDKAGNQKKKVMN